MPNDLTKEATEALRARVRVTLSVNVKGDDLMVDTSIENNGAAKLHVFDVLWDYTQTGTIVRAPSEAYVCVQDGELRFAHRQLPYPTGKLILLRISPNLTPLEPGAALRRHMRYPIPVEEYSCFFPKEPDSAVEILESRSARFFCDVVTGAADGAFRASSIGGLEIVNVTKLGNVTTLESNSVPCAVKVARRRDEFQRF